MLVAQAGSVRDVAYAQVQAGLWNQATTLDNARQTRLATAEVAWRDQQYTQQVAVTTALASTSATPWAAFQRDLALAQQSWWTTTGVSYTASVANANLAATAYQTLVSTAYVAKAQLLATLDLNAAKAQAADALAQTTAIALAEKAHEDGLATARREYLVNMAHALVDQRNLLANAEYKRLAEVSFDYDGSVRSANNDRQSDEQSAKAAHSTSVAGVEGQYGVNSAQANLKYAQDSAGHTQTWTTGRAAAEKGYAALEAVAYQTLSITTGALDTAYRRQAAQTQQAALASLAQNSATPWSALEAARAAAFADWTGTTTGAADIRRTTVANAQAAFELRQAAADEVYSVASGNASNAQWISEAQAALTTAQAKAASLMAGANAGQYDVTLPCADALPAHDDIVDVLLPGTYTAPAAKFDATYEAFGLADAPSTMPGYYGYGWNGYGWNGWWGCYGWWNASWWNGGYWYGWYGDGLANDMARLDTAAAASVSNPQHESANTPTSPEDLALNDSDFDEPAIDLAVSPPSSLGSPTVSITSKESLRGNLCDLGAKAAALINPWTDQQKDEFAAGIVDGFIDGLKQLIELATIVRDASIIAAPDAVSNALTPCFPANLVIGKVMESSSWYQQKRQAAEQRMIALLEPYMDLGIQLQQVPAIAGQIAEVAQEVLKAFNASSVLSSSALATCMTLGGVKQDLQKTLNRVFANLSPLASKLCEDLIDKLQPRPLGHVTGLVLYQVVETVVISTVTCGVAAAMEGARLVTLGQRLLKLPFIAESADLVRTVRNTIGEFRLFGKEKAAIDVARRVYIGPPLESLFRANMKRTNPSAFSSAEKSALGEARTALTMRRAGFEELPARLPRNQGFDGVWIKRAADGSITDIVITESKFSSSGTLRLRDTATMGRQLSPAWIDGNIEKMLKSADPALIRSGMLLQANRSMIRAKAAVLDPQGILRFSTH